MRTLSVVVGTLSLLVSAVGVTNAAPSGVAMPFELAFGRSLIGYDQQPTFSADGRLLVYGVHTPPAKSPGGVRYMETGAPAAVVGNTLFLADTKGARRTPIGPQGADCWRPVFSADATRVAFYCDAGGVVNLWVHDLAKGASRRVSPVAVKPTLWSGDEPQWSADGKEVIVPLASGVSPVPPNSMAAATSENGVRVVVHVAGGEGPKEKAPSEMASLDEFYNRESNAGVGAINVQSGEVRTIVPANAKPSPSVSLLSPSGRWLAYLSVYHKPKSIQSTMYNDILVAPVAGGEPKVVAADHLVTEFNYFTDAYAWHPTRDQLFWVQDKKLWTVDLTDGTGTPHVLAPNLTDVTVQPIVVTRDGSAVIVGVRPVDLHDYNDPHPQALAVVPLNGAEPRILQLATDQVFQDVLRYGRSVAWQPQSDSITLRARVPASAETLVSRLNLRSGEIRTLWKELAKLQPAGALPDHSAFIAAFENLNTPVDYYRFAADFGSKQKLSDVEPRLAGVHFGTADMFQTTVPQFDGSVTQVTTAVLLPEGAKRGDRLPALVFLYPGSKVSRSAAEFGGGAPSTIPVSLLTTRGYAVVLAELPIGPEGKPGNPATEMVDVLIPQIYRAADLGYIDLARIAVSGQSYGGYGTASIVSGTDIFRAGVAISGLYDLPGDYAWMDKLGGDDGARWSETGQGRMGSPPWSDLHRYLTNSPYYRADRIHTPLLMLHGQSDETCHVEDARKMFNALRRLGRTVQLAEYAGEGHVVTDWSVPNATDAARRMVGFLDQYVKGKPPVVGAKVADARSGPVR